MVIIQSARFFTSGGKRSEFPSDGLPQIGFAGRSNVGKSSLINMLTRRKGLAHSSKSPGRTQRVNFFAINDRFYFVDLPGYGYAKVPDSVRRQWRGMMDEYLRENAALRAVVALLDARHEPTRLDAQLLDYLMEAGVRALPVATKIDKLKRSQRARSLKRLKAFTSRVTDISPIPVSAQTGEGKTEILNEIARLVDFKSEPPPTDLYL